MAFFQDVVRSLNQVTGSAGPRMMINHKIARYGHMTELTIDPEQKLITATLQLKGEKEPIQLRLARYQLETAGSSDTLTVGEVYVSREWMQALAADLVQSKPMPLPAAAAKWLRLIL